jgi:hypothetical protein
VPNLDALNAANDAAKSATDAHNLLLTSKGAVGDDGTGGSGLQSLALAVQQLSVAVAHLAAGQP